MPDDQTRLIKDLLSFWYFITTAEGTLSTARSIASLNINPDRDWPNLPPGVAGADGTPPTLGLASSYLNQVLDATSTLGIALRGSNGPWDFFTSKAPNGWGAATQSLPAGTSKTALKQIWLLLTTRADFRLTQTVINNPVGLAAAAGAILSNAELSPASVRPLIGHTNAKAFNDTIGSFQTLARQAGMGWNGGGSHPSPNEIVTNFPAAADGPQ